jgi:hypothetical protein
VQAPQGPPHSHLYHLEQASPEAADAAETLCSLNFAARVRGVELNASRRKADAAGYAPGGTVAATKTALANSAALTSSEGKPTAALRACSTPNIDTCKGPASAAKSAAAAPPARATPRRLEKDASVRRSLDKENSGLGE